MRRFGKFVSANGLNDALEGYSIDPRFLSEAKKRRVYASCKAVKAASRKAAVTIRAARVVDPDVDARGFFKATFEVNKKTRAAIRGLFATLQKTEFAAKKKDDAAIRCAAYLFNYSLSSKTYSHGDALSNACFAALNKCQKFEALK